MFAASRQHKINLMSALISPVTDIATLQMRHHFIEHKVFPQYPQVFMSQILPAAVVADKTCIEAVDLWRGNDFRRLAQTERANDMGDEGGFQDTQIVCNGRTAYFTRTGEPRRLEDAAALCKDEFGKLLKGIAPFQPEKFLNIFGPIGIDPFLKIPLLNIFRQKEWRQSAAQKPVLQIQLFCVGEVAQSHRSEPEIALASCKGVFEFARRTQRRRTGSDDSNGRVVVRSDLQQFGGILQTMYFVKDNALST